MSGRRRFAMHGVCGVLAALLVVLVLPGAVRTVRAQPPAAEPCTDLGVVTLPEPGVVPVVVTYMKNSRRPDDNVESKKLSRGRMTQGFQPDGEFQRVWGPLGIRFALLGVRTCTYTLDHPSQDPDLQNPRHDVPNPGGNFNTVFMKFLRKFNMREIQTASGKVKFRGMDLYLLWQIEGTDAGYGIRPRFGKVNEESGLPNEPVRGKPGAVWLDTKCVANADMTPEDFCSAAFSHEAGHFFGLCHCCLRSDSSATAQKCRNFLRPRYCPDPSLFSASPPECGDDFDDRLMSATNTFETRHNLGVKPCEKTTALAGKEKVLKHGANWMGGSQ